MVIIVIMNGNGKILPGMEENPYPRGHGGKLLICNRPYPAEEVPCEPLCSLWGRFSPGRYGLPPVLICRRASSHACRGSRPVTCLYQAGWKVQAQASLTAPRIMAPNVPGSPIVLW